MRAASHRVLGNTLTAGGWRLLRVHAPELVKSARPGHRLALAAPAVEVALTEASESEGWLAALAPPSQAPHLERLTPGARLPGLALAADGWPEPPPEPVVVLGSGSGIASALFLAARLTLPPLLIALGAGYPPPFRVVPSRHLVAGLPPHVIGAAPTLEAVGIASRIACEQELPGCYEGSAVELLERWLAARTDRVTVFACAPPRELAALAKRRDLQLVPLEAA